MLTRSVISGSGEFGLMVATPSLGMPKMILSAPAVALACWIAALKVHSPIDSAAVHNPSAVLASAKSAVELTKKLDSAWAGLPSPTSIMLATTSVATKPRAAATVLLVFGVWRGAPSCHAQRRLSSSLSSASWRSRNVCVGLIWWYIATSSFSPAYPLAGLAL